MVPFKILSERGLGGEGRLLTDVFMGKKKLSGFSPTVDKKLCDSKHLEQEPRG